MHAGAPVHALGVDAAGSKGWVGVVVGADGFVAAHVALTVAELISDAEADPSLGGRPLLAVGVDIPIGLVDGPARSADLAARAFVGPRRSSVFPAPHPDVLALDDHGEVNRRLAQLGHPGLSIQGFRLFPRIREVAGLAHDQRVVEVFPEASFRAMAGEHLQSSKKTWNGSARRRTLLASTDPAIVLPGDLGPAGQVPVDDVLDAAAAAWSAWRVATGIAEPHGHDIEPVTGRRIAMWV
ncbi:MAG: hypothetical protein JWM89_3783 [Acidimicrobiales bacterium]|nr:hypothetical protein [Acidimicrobiales bacterium]